MQIEKNIPLHRKASQLGGGRRRYPWNEMEVGDSIFFEGQNTQGKAANSSKAWARLHGVKFMSRSVEGGVRIWRIA